MKHLDHYGQLRLAHLQSRKPHLYHSMQNSELLIEHLLHSQKQAK